MAFQADAFQADAFQIGGEVVTATSGSLEVPMPKIWVLGRDEKIRAVLRNNGSACPFWHDKHTERTDYYHTLDFTCAADHEDSEHVVEGAYVLISDLDDVFRELIIAKIARDTDAAGRRTLVVSCVGAEQELNSSFVMQTPVATAGAVALVTSLLGFTRWDPGDIEWAGNITIGFLEIPSVWEALCNVAAKLGLELSGRVTLTGAAVTGHYIDAHVSRGSTRGMCLTYGHDLATCRREGDATPGKQCTAMIGLGASQPDGSLLMFTDEVWTTTSGDPCDKPDNQWWVADEIALDTYGMPGVAGARYHRYGVYRDPECTSAAELLTATYNELQTRRVPQVTYTVGVVSLERYPEQIPGAGDYSHERMRIGDTIAVRDASLDIEVGLRVVEVSRCYTDPTKDSVVVGVPKKRLTHTLVDLLKARRHMHTLEGTWTGP
jgi:phage minor structural protein